MNTTRVHYAPGADIPCKAAGALKAGTFVKVSKTIEGRNPVVAPATAGSTPLGVVAHDAAEGDIVTVHTGGVIEINGAGIAAGDLVAAGTSGAAAKASDSAAAVGIALTGVADGAVVVKLK